MLQLAVAVVTCCLAYSVALNLQRPFTVPPYGYRGSNQHTHGFFCHRRRDVTVVVLAASITTSLESICQSLQETFKPVKNELSKTCRVNVSPATKTDRLGLIAMEPISKGEVVLAMPYDDRYILSADLAENIVFNGLLPDNYESWTGEKGLIALLILNEIARASGMGGIDKPERSKEMQTFMVSWVAALPDPDSLNHPLLWSEEDQEVLQSSSTSKIYRQLDDLEEDATWLETNVFVNDRNKFPETVTWNNREIPCFSVQGYKWAMALSSSRSFFVDGRLRMIPLLDMCNHADTGEEVKAGTMGPFGTIKGVQLIASTNVKAGEEIYCSYGPKSAADYMLEHGFCPTMSFNTAVSELVFEVDSSDRFYDDKMDILEFETYDQAPMDPVQAFDVVSAPGRDGEPDPAMMQFLRLSKLGGTDAFLLESIFRKEVWGFMSLPVSERNELEVVNAITEACKRAVDDLMQCPTGGPPICSKLRESEIKALTRTMEFLQREKEALDLKEYYQERRLKDLGLDSEWSSDDDIDPGMSYSGQKRTPGGADYDW